MTKLEAVNRIVTDAGGLRVSALNTGGADFAAIAESFLDQHEEDIQAKGWKYNTRTNVELTADGNGRFALPTGTYRINSDGQDVSIETTQLGTYLYDLTENTNVWDIDTIRVTYVLRYEFHCIPHEIQAYIVACASVKFNMTYGRPDLTRMLQLREFSAKIAADRFEQYAKRVNIFNTAEGREFRGSRRVTLSDVFGVST